MPLLFFKLFVPPCIHLLPAQAPRTQVWHSDCNVVKPAQTPDGLCGESTPRNSRRRRTKKGQRRDTPSHGSDARGAPQPSKYSTACKRHGIGHTILYTNRRRREKGKRQRRTLSLSLFPSLSDQATALDKHMIAVQHCRSFPPSAATVSELMISILSLTSSRDTFCHIPCAPITVNGGVHHTDCRQRHQMHTAYR